MTKVQILVDISGTRDGADWPKRGGVLEVSAEEAKELIHAGLARVPKKDDPEVETAAAPKAKTETRKGLTTKSVE